MLALAVTCALGIATCIIISLRNLDLSKQNQKLTAENKKLLSLRDPGTGLTTAQISEEFREFVLSVEGRVSPEIDSVLQKLNASSQERPVELALTSPKSENEKLCASIVKMISSYESDVFRYQALKQIALNDKAIKNLSYEEKIKILEEFDNDYYKNQAQSLL